MTDRASAEGLREAIRAALNELGVPGPGYPAPVANAVDILRAALRPSESDSTVFELLVGLGVPGSLAGAAEERILEVARSQADRASAEGGLRAEDVEWLVWFARKSKGTVAEVAQRAIEQNPALRDTGTVHLRHVRPIRSHPRPSLHPAGDAR